MNDQQIIFFVDSANRESATRWLQSGVATGLTTNPTILKRAGATIADVSEIANWATGSGAQEVCFQTWGSTENEWYDNAQRLLEAAPEAVIKVPCTERGSRVITRLKHQGVPILLTAAYSARQALIASALDVKYVAPYFNRMNMNGINALDEFRRMTQYLPVAPGAPRIMAASIKSSAEVASLVGAGIRTFTLAPEVLEDLLRNHLSEQAVEDFEVDMLNVLQRHP